jgi:large subunit ribosomal protein L45
MQALYVFHQPVRFKSTEFGGFTRDKYLAKRFKKAREYVRSRLKSPLRTETQGFRAMKWPMAIASLNRLLFEHAPLEKKDRAPISSKLGRSQRWADSKESLSTLYSIATIRRKLRKVDPYLPIEFARRVQDMFVATNAALQGRMKEKLRMLTTENALNSLKSEFDDKHFVWELVEEVERPHVLVAKVAPMTTKDNLFAQVVVRIHTQQVLAVYDKSGRLYRGHPTEPRTVVDYVVMERHIVDPNSSWRIAGKLMPAPKHATS